MNCTPQSAVAFDDLLNKWLPLAEWFGFFALPILIVSSAFLIIRKRNLLKSPDLYLVLMALVVICVFGIAALFPAHL
jgi:hypothetical protein